MERLHTVNLGQMRLQGDGTRLFQVVSSVCPLPNVYTIGASSPLGRAGVIEVDILFDTKRIMVDDARRATWTVSGEFGEGGQREVRRRVVGFSPTRVIVGGEQREQGWALPILQTDLPIFPVGKREIDILDARLTFGDRVRVGIGDISQVSFAMREGRNS